jgi:4a-hydroxytetrahydrobiopterin dehydratase
MSETIAPRRFHELGAWRVIREAACARFRTGSFAEGVALVAAIRGVADVAGRYPDVDLRTDVVAVRLRRNFAGELTEADLALAEAITGAARELGARPDPGTLQTVQIAIDALEIPVVIPFWRAVLGYEPLGEEDLYDPSFLEPPFWFQQMDAPRPQRNRIHIDLYVPADQAEARVAAALAAGGRVVYDAHAPEWWTLADPEGNEVDVAPWPDQG